MATRDWFLEGVVFAASSPIGERKERAAELREIESGGRYLEVLVGYPAKLGDVVSKRVFQLRELEHEPADLAISTIPVGRFDG